MIVLDREPPAQGADGTVGLPLETERLRLRPYRLTDVDELHRLWIDPEVCRYLWDGVRIARERAASTVADAIRCFEERGFGQWVVCLRDSPSVIGFCGLLPAERASEAELLYGLAPAHWGRGLATEAARTMVRLGFEQHGLTRIVAICDTPNVASIRVMRRVGMRLDGTVRLSLGPGVRYALTRDQFVADTAIGARQRS